LILRANWPTILPSWNGVKSYWPDWATKWMEPMSVPVSPSEQHFATCVAFTEGKNACGRGAVSFIADAAGVTRLKGLRQDAPMRVLLPIAPRNEPAEAAFTNTGGGLVGGDAVEMAVSVGAGAAVLAYAQAAEKVYRSVDVGCSVEVRAVVEDDGWLEWLPQETILFDQSRLHRRTVLDVAVNGRALCGEILVFGREAHGETYQRGSAHELWEVRRQGRLIWGDALRLDGAVRTALDHPAGFAGASVCATLVAVLPEADVSEAAVELLRAVPQHDAVRRGFTLVNGVLVGRWLAADGEALRKDYGRVWRRARQSFGGWQDRLPRLWSM
jgi:urease accessory protein